MAGETATGQVWRCVGCGFEAAAGESWTEIDHPTLGTVTQCPECGSTDVHSAR